MHRAVWNLGCIFELLHMADSDADPDAGNTDTDTGNTGTDPDSGNAIICPGG